MSEPDLIAPWKCAVVQSFRRVAVPDWINRCLASVEGWARMHGHDYKFWGDEIYDVCGPRYLASGLRNPQAITNLARLLLTRQYLRDQGYDAVIWLDADVFIFDPKSFSIGASPDSLELGYGLGREVWIHDNNHAEGPMAHNAFTYFTRQAKDLDFLIDVTRYIGSRPLQHNFQVGVKLLRGLHYSLGFELLPQVAVFSPRLISAICKNEVELLRTYGNLFGYASHGANLGLSIGDYVGESNLLQAMNILESSAGMAVNQHAHLSWTAHPVRNPR